MDNEPSSAAIREPIERAEKNSRPTAPPVGILSTNRQSRSAAIRSLFPAHQQRTQHLQVSIIVAGIESQLVFLPNQIAKLGFATYVASKDRASDRDDHIAGYPARMYPYYVLVDADGKVDMHGSIRGNDGEVLSRLNELHDQSVRE